MSTETVKRVLEMVFDNDKFEKNAQTTISTLGKLESSLKLDGATNGLKELMKFDFGGANLKGLISSIETTANKYSWFEQIAIGAYRKIGEAATQYLGKQVMDLTGINQAITGWHKYETEIEAVQTIMNASGKSMKQVEKYLNKLSIYTDETSYSYDAMVTNIGKFNAAGVKDLNVATNAMMGIGNMAGYFGVNATKATHAMEGFAKAMGKGYMDSASWQWIETAGMNASAIQQAFIDTAVQLGTIEKKGKNLYKVGKKTEFTAEQFKNVLSKKWLTKDVITATLNKYSAGMNDIIKKYEEFGGEVSIATILEQYGDEFDQLTVKAFSAAQETKTFSDAIGALKEVTASGWRQTFRYIFGNYEEARDMWGAFVEEAWDIFAGKGNQRNDLLKGWYKAGGRDVLLEGIANLWEGVRNIAAPIQQAWDKIFPKKTVEDLLGLTNKFKDFTERFKNLFAVFDPEKNKLTKTVTEIAEVTESAYGPVAKTTKALEKLAKAVMRGDWGNGEARRKALEKAGYSYEMVQNRVNELVEIENGWAKGTLIRRKVKKDPMVTVQKEIQKEVPLTEEEYRHLVSTYDESASRAQKLTQIMEGLFSAMAIGRDIIKEIGKEMGHFFSEVTRKSYPAINAVVNAVTKIATNITQFYDRLKQSNGIQNAVKNISEALSDVVSAFANTVIPFIVNNLMDLGHFLATDVYPILKSIYGVGRDIVTKVWKKLNTGKGFKALYKSIGGIWETVKDVFKGVRNYIKNIGGSIFDSFSDFFKKISGESKDFSIGDVIAGIIDFAAEKIAGFIDILLDLKNVLKEVFTKIDLSKVIAWLVRKGLPALLNLANGIYNVFVNQIYPVLKKIWDTGSEIITGIWTTITTGSGFKKLGGSLKGVWETVKQIAGSVWETVKRVGGDLWTEIEKIIRTLTGATEDMTFGEVIGLVFDKIAGKIADFITSIGWAKDKVIEFFQAFAGKDAKKVETLTASMQSVSENLQQTSDKTLSPVKKVLEDIFAFLTDFGNKLKNPVKTITDAISGIMTGIVGSFTGLTWEKIAKTLQNTGIGVFFGVLAKKIAESKTSIDSIPSNFNKVLIGIYDTLNLYQSNIKGSALKQAAEAIGILVLSVIVLSAVDIDMQKVTDFATSMTMILMVATWFVKGLNELKKLGAKNKENVYQIVGLEEFLKDSKFNVNLAAATEKFVKPIGDFLTGMQKVFDKKLNGGQLAKAFLFVSGAIGIIVYIIKLIKDEQWDLTVFDQNGKMTDFGMILAFITGVGVVMAAMIRLAGGKQTMGAALTWITAAVAIKMVTDFMWKLVSTGTFNEDKLGRMLMIFVFMAGVMTAIGAAIAATSKEMSYDKTTNKDGSSKVTKSRSGNSPFGIAFAVLAFAAAFNLMVPALREMGNMSKSGMENILEFLVIFGLVVAGLSYMSKVVGKDSNANPKAINKIAWGLIGALAAMGIIAGMMENFGTTGTSVLKVGFMIIVLAGAVALLAGIVTVLDEDKLVKIGDAMFEFGIGMAGVAAAAWIFGKAMKDIVDGITYLGDVITNEETAEKFKEGIAFIVLAIAAAIIIHKSKIIDAFAQFIGGAVKFFLGKINWMGEQLFSFIEGVVKFITGKKGKILIYLAIILALFSDTLAQLIPGFVQEIIRLFMVIIDSLSLSVLTQGAQLFYSIGRFGASIVQAFFDAIARNFKEHGVPQWLDDLTGGKISNWIEETLGDTSTLEQEIRDDITNLQGADNALDEYAKEQERIQTKLERQGKRYNRGFNNNNASNTEDVTERNPLSAGIGGFKQLLGGVDLGTIQESLGENGIGGAINAFNNGELDTSNMVNSLLTGTDEMASASETFSEAIPDGMKESLETAGVSVEGTINGILGNITGSKKEVKKEAETAAEETVEAVNKKLAKVTTGGHIKKKTQEELDEYYKSLEENKEKLPGYVEFNIVEPVEKETEKLAPKVSANASKAAGVIGPELAAKKDEVSTKTDENLVQPVDDALSKLAPKAGARASEAVGAFIQNLSGSEKEGLEETDEKEIGRIAEREIATPVRDALDAANLLPEPFKSIALKNYISDIASLFSQADFSTEVLNSIYPVEEVLSKLPDSVSGYARSAIESFMSVLYENSENGEVEETLDENFAQPFYQFFSMLPEQMRTDLSGSFGDLLSILIPDNIEQQVSEDLVGAIITALQNGDTEGVSNAVKTLVDPINTMLSSLPGVSTEAVEDFIDAMVNEMVSELNIGKVETNTDAGVVQPMDNAMAVLPDKMANRADDAVNGFVNRVMSQENTSKVSSAGSHMASTFMGAYDKDTGTSSPSREMMWRADMAINGFVGQIYNRIDSVRSAAMSIASALVETMSAGLQTDLNTSPTITPVVDTASLSAGAGTFNSYFGGRTFSAGVGNLANATADLSTSLASKAFDGFNQNKIENLAQAEILNSNSDVVAAIGGLNDRIGGLEEAFSNTAVVLDSGALVGATAKQMDNALGRFKVLKGRGI